MKKRRQQVQQSQDQSPTLLVFRSLRKRRFSECGTEYPRPSWLEPLMLMAPQICQSAVCPVATDGDHGHQCTTWALIIPQRRGSVDTGCTKCQSHGGNSRSQEPSILPWLTCPQLIWAYLSSLPSYFWGWEIQTWVFVTLSISSLLNSLSEGSWAGLSFSPLLIFTTFKLV